MKKKILGVLGGMGPAAGARFLALVTEFTKAECDREHIEVLLHSLPTIPDRTDFILGKSASSPLPAMKRAVLGLASAGAEIIAVPCNTAEYFHSKIQSVCPVPIIRTAYESVRFASSRGVKKLGILATEGTLHAEIYQKYLAARGMDFAAPRRATQEEINKLIYSHIKKSLAGGENTLLSVERELRNAGCDAAVLGCTELSLVPREQESGFFIDSLSVLAAVSVHACGYPLSKKGKLYIT